MPHTDNNQVVILHVNSIYGAKTKKGLVGIQRGEQEETYYMTPAEARSHAADILQCCTAAEMDESIMWFLTKRLGLDENRALLALRDMRIQREKIHGDQTNYNPNQ